MRTALVLLSLLAFVVPAGALPPQAEPAVVEFGGCEAHGTSVCSFTVNVPPGVGEVCLDGACTPGAFPWAVNDNLGVLTVIEIVVWSAERSYRFQCIVELLVTTCGSDAMPQNPLGGLPAMSIGSGQYQGWAGVRYGDTADWAVSIQGLATQPA